PGRSAVPFARIGEVASPVADIGQELHRTSGLAAPCQPARSAGERCRATFPVPPSAETRLYRVGPAGDRLPPSRRALDTYLSGRAVRGVTPPEDIFSRTGPQPPAEIELRCFEENQLPERSIQGGLPRTFALPEAWPCELVAP